MHVAVMGTGYVGLVTGTCLADSGNDVACIDVDAAKIEKLKKGVIPIYEPGLGEMVEQNLRDGRLNFTTNLVEGIEKARVIFVCVGTPQGEDGSADLTALWNVTDAIRREAKESKIVVVKSTVPVGTNARVRQRLNDGAVIQHRTASNPEFLKEGYAVEDFMRPDRVVVGVLEQEVADTLRELHGPFLRTDHPFLVMSPESAEMTKYVANCMLATKISFINEMANVCERLGADINAVRQGIGHDSRIGFQFLHPGVGYGGSCFPKDIRAMISLSENCGVQPRILWSVDAVNEAQKNVLFTKLQEAFKGQLAGLTIAIWGLAFKPRTDDIREAPALALIRSLLGEGCKLQVHDPKAMENVRQIFKDRIRYCERAYQAIEGADALAIATEWQEFRNPDFALMRRTLKRPLIVDGRNLYEPFHMRELGFTYYSIGRKAAKPN